MSTPTILVSVVAIALLVRQLVILTAIVRSSRFVILSISGRTAARGLSTYSPEFFIVVPVLREAPVISEAIAHFRAMTETYCAKLVIVTTERETVKVSNNLAHCDTVSLVRELAIGSDFVHLHYPDPFGLKGDQLNFAAERCISELLSSTSPDDAFLVCYDADSRPPASSIKDFENSIRAFPTANVFHQSSRFELRLERGEPRRGLLSRLSRAMCDGGALRANRFVLGFEIPRLNNRVIANGRLKRKICSYVYAHVTGHGLCIRLSLLQNLPFPQRSPLEDMHYSFYLGSRNLSMIAVPSLDRAEVPDTLSAQVKQAARWFIGPARFRRYLNDPSTRRGWRARAMAFSAFGSSLEWLGCAVVPVLAAWMLCDGNSFVRVITAGLVAVYVTQLLITEAILGADDSRRQRLVRVITCPFATVLFGIGGFIGAIFLTVGTSMVGKTERADVS